jgi:hypothetical protein
MSDTAVMAKTSGSANVSSELETLEFAAVLISESRRGRR